MERTYSTLLINSSGRFLSVYERDGMLLTLADGERQTVETDAAGLYARYESVEWLPEGPVFKKRKDFDEARTPGTVRLVFVNCWQNAVEEREIPGIGTLHLPKGIPVYVDVEPGHPLAAKKGMEVREVEDWKESTAFPGYIWQSKSVRDIWFDRPEQEPLDAAKEIENAAT